MSVAELTLLLGVTDAPVLVVEFGPVRPQSRSPPSPSGCHIFPMIRTVRS